MKPISFYCEMESARLYKSTGLAKITFSVDRAKMASQPGLWESLTALDIDEKDPALRLMIIKESDAIKLEEMAEAKEEKIHTKELVDSGVKERTDSQKFFHGFLMNNKNFWRYMDWSLQVTGTNASNAKNRFCEDAQVKSMTQLEDGYFERTINDFNEWLKKGEKE